MEEAALGEWIRHEPSEETAGRVQGRTGTSLSIVTNSVPVALSCSGLPDVAVYVPCGRLNSDGAIYDATALEFVRPLNFDVGFVSGTGVSADFGLSVDIY